MLVSGANSAYAGNITVTGGFITLGNANALGLTSNTLTLAGGGVNIHAVDAIAAKGRFASFVWVQREDVEKAAEALGV